ncbi:MAG: MarC family protein [Holophaga sp.]|nr:MarC family protein [Holophaga sp.]
MEFVAPFLKSLVLVPLTLLPIINPLSAAPVFITTAGSNPEVVRRMARQIAINSWCILVASMLVGIYVLDIFGISLAIVRVGGGLLVAASGWRMLNNTGKSDVQQAVAEMPADLTHTEIVLRSFFPITFPLTTGPGSIAAAIALGVHLPRTPALYLLGATIAILGVAITALVVYLCYRHAAGLLAMLGQVGTMVIMRMLAFILLCIGIEIMWTGWAALNHLH